MYIHAPNSLPGPITKERPWWNDLPSGTMETAASSSPPPGASAVKPIDENPPKPPESPIRTELVARIRREIQAGTYDTPEKLEAALDRMLERLEED